ncbi:MAG: hypothetical protein E7324_07510 [Clostridiales bacterium]|nr:hypothetical protein [Clostridiales bacterium]
MGRLSYVLKRIRKMDFGRMRETAKMLHKKTGKSTLWLLADMARCAAKYNAGYIDYKIAEMYRLNDAQRRSVITRGISNEIVRRMNDKAYWHFFDDKTQFNALFEKWVNRSWIKIDESLTKEALSAFLQDKDQAIFKPLEGSSGQGIVKYEKKDWQDLLLFMEQLSEAGAGILEEVVIQHPEMAKMCPTSVNTIRIATLLGEKQQGIVYAFLRIGNGKVMDNVDCGGMAARVDLESGKLLTVGADKQGNTFDTHPMTGTPIIGFQVPYFEEAKQMCLEAMKVVPQVRFVAWDVAITENGPVFIEGNSFPSHAVPQFAAHYPDGIGIMPEFRKFMNI